MASEPFLSLGFAGVDWIEHYLVHGPGDVQGQRVELDDEFAAFIVKSYRVDGNGDRRVRRAFLSRSKGRSKSGLAAMIACFEALGPCRFDHWAVEGEVSPWGYEYEAGEPVGRALIYVEILNVATEEGQAGNTYDAIHYMLNAETASAELVADYGRIDVGLTRTILPDRRGFIEPVSSADTSKDGGKSTFIVADETHLWVLPRLKRLHSIMTRNLLKRKIASGWMLETSTMYAEGEGSVAEGTHTYAKLEQRDGTLLFDHRQASDKWNLDNRAERLSALREAYGPAAEWMNLEAIADSWDDPQESKAEFRRFWLNQPVPTVVEEPSVIPLGSWKAQIDSGSCIAEGVALALEVAQDNEWACIGAAGKRSDGGLHVQVVENHPGTGWIVEKALLHAATHGKRIALSPNSPAGSLIADLEAAGFAVTQLRPGDYARACGDFYNGVVQGRIWHVDQPELNVAVKFAAKRASADAWIFDRKRPKVDISPLAAVVLAGWAHRNATPRNAGRGRVIALT